MSTHHDHAEALASLARDVPHEQLVIAIERALADAAAKAIDATTARAAWDDERLARDLDAATQATRAEIERLRARVAELEGAVAEHVACTCDGSHPDCDSSESWPQEYDDGTVRHAPWCNATSPLAKVLEGSSSALSAAVAAEREACAQVADIPRVASTDAVARAIRARGTP